MTLLLFI